ncbi:MAG: 6-phosphogluconolactonase [Spirochaetia bacterium]|jgi:6-phosphogluconolactonase
MRDAPTPDREGAFPPPLPQTLVVEDARALAEQASSLLLSTIEDSLTARGHARIILAGGDTPRETYALVGEGLRTRKVPVERLAWFFGDERWVNRSHPRSNEGMAREMLLGRIGAPEVTIHSWDAGWGNPVECARLYGRRVRELMGSPADAPDLLILGLGADGHTASLFPGATAHLPGGARVPVSPDMPGEAAAVQGIAERGWRLTLCPVFLRTSRCVVFLAAGADKAPALRRARSGESATPAAWIRGAATWFVATREALGTEEPGYGREILHA